MRRAIHEVLVKSGAYRLSKAPATAGAWRALPIDLAPVRAWYAAHPESARSCVDAADALLAGRMRFFGALDLEIGWPPAWLRHPQTGMVWPADRHWTESRDSSTAYGDIKWIWEPARFGFAWLLARATVASGDERYARELWRGVRSWADANPAYLGPGWSCGQETALRAIALAFAAAVVPPPPVDARLVGELLHASARRIALTLHHSLSQRNNHALGEAVGLWTLAMLAPVATREVAHWRAIAASALEEAVRDQFAADGAYIQESVSYHRFAVQMLAWLRWVGHACVAPLPDGVTAALARSRDLLAGLLPAEGGALPNYGHNDGAQLLLLSSAAHADYRPTLKLLGLELPAGPWDEAAAWLGTEPTGARHDEPLRATSSGYVTARAGAWMAFARVPCIRDHRPAQADALHLDVWRGSRNVALDPGTFSYSSPPPWDNRLAETRVHNTCSIGEASQMRRRGRFLWTQWTCAELLATAATPARVAMLARTRAAWSSDHLHWRLVVVDAMGVDVFDALIGTSEACLRLHWNLDGIAWLRRDATWSDGDLAVAIHAPPAARIADVRGDPASARGWSSRSYGHREPCTAIDVALQARTAAFHTRLGAPVALDERVARAWHAGDHRDAFELATAK